MFVACGVNTAIDQCFSLSDINCTRTAGGVLLWRFELDTLRLTAVQLQNAQDTGADCSRMCTLHVATSSSRPLRSRVLASSYTQHLRTHCIPPSTSPECPCLRLRRRRQRSRPHTPRRGTEVGAVKGTAAKTTSRPEVCPANGRTVLGVQMELALLVMHDPAMIRPHVQSQGTTGRLAANTSIAASHARAQEDRACLGGRS